MAWDLVPFQKIHNTKIMQSILEILGIIYKFLDHNQGLSFFSKHFPAIGHQANKSQKIQITIGKTKRFQLLLITISIVQKSTDVE
jgi:hypothetical protein